MHSYLLYTYKFLKHVYFTTSDFIFEDHQPLKNLWISCAYY